ncbi:hypothetical protein KC19_2G085400 [Ceratodon purpureus]|uniref:Protein kinase domain-containing protein n=1 Tax=Ceratodon purpureus TaxID=3225 RepID=A0A8T0IRK3_CERPU|nr:hypothetical protein KC19_2G085400 [Ceratodon purpureus]
MANTNDSPATGQAEHAATASTTYFTAVKEHAATSSTTYFTSLEEQIERSKSHWSEVAQFESDTDSDDEEAVLVDNIRVFLGLTMHPTWGSFFVWFSTGPSLANEQIGQLFEARKFAQGGQAELYDVKIRWWNPEHDKYDQELGRQWVLKVFNKGTKLRRLQSQWPQGLLQFHAERMERSKLGTPALGVRYFCDVYYGTLLTDGRFAFLMRRERQDLRSMLDDSKTTQSSGPFWQNLLDSFKRKEDLVPYNEGVLEMMMCWIALGMDWLHDHNIVHRDIKASNVLFALNEGRGWGCYIADWECSVGVVGTGFFRAPEILQALKDGNASSNCNLFTKASDVYSFGMTCYELLTGKLPFEGHPCMDYDLVLKGQRPEVPKSVDNWIQELLSWCWQSNPKARPTSGEILNFLEANSSSAAILREKIRNVVPERNPFVSDQT